MKRVIHVIFVIVTLLSFFAVARWIFNTTAGFNRQLDLFSTVIIGFFIVPLTLTAVLAIVYLVRVGNNPDKAVVKFETLLCLIMIPLSATITFSPLISPGPVREIIFADTIRPTDDGRLEYRLELVNLFQRNATARLFVRDLDTLEEFYIPIGIPRVDEIGGISLPHRTDFLWGRMERGETSDQYILRIPAGQGYRSTFIRRMRFQYMTIRSGMSLTFEIDIPSRTAVMIDYHQETRQEFLERHGWFDGDVAPQE